METSHPLKALGVVSPDPINDLSSMKKNYLLIVTLLFISISAIAQPVRFDDDWKFYRGGAQGAEKPPFDDSSWRKIDLPHDWSIENLPGTASPFDAKAISGVSGGFTTGGTGWYRKTFQVADSVKNKRLYIQFDGVYMNAEVWLNGKLLGHHPYGYTTFRYDITTDVLQGQLNTLAVKVKNEGENSRWYSGSGIYRHVWLIVKNPVHVAVWGTYITTPVATAASAKVNIQTTLKNQTKAEANVTISYRVLDATGKMVAETKTNVNAKDESKAEQLLEVKSPALWSVDSPSLYTLITEVYQGSSLKDKTETRFGIRTIAFTPTQGFTLNGNPLKLKGGCLHHDNGPLGARAYDRAEERKIELLKASGYNAIRCSHNPPSQAFLDACDKLGMLVIDEAFDMWRDAKNPFDYSLYFHLRWKEDVASMVVRDRNHPSIILWSIGNEIPNMDNKEVAADAKMISDFIKSLDPTRPTSAAVNGLSEKKDPFFASFDIAGYNYAYGGDHNQKSIYETDHERLPQRIMYGSESYALEAFGSWMNVIDYPWVIGDFVWTSFDYIGEASIGWRGYWQEQNFYPWNLAYCGDIDICGWKRPQSYYRDALWKKNQVSVFVKPPQPSFELNTARQDWSKWHWYDVVDSWNWQGQEGKPLEVDVYSSCTAVELFLNGKSLGKKNTNRQTQFKETWMVPYQSGELKAVGYEGKKKVSESILRTAAAPDRIKLSADKNEILSDNQDLSYVTVELTDTKGIRNPLSDQSVTFTIEGPATIVGVGNANPMSVESYQASTRKAWQGRCLVVIKSGKEKGNVKLTASAAGVTSASITLLVK